MLIRRVMVSIAVLAVAGCTQSVNDAGPTPSDLSDALLTVTDLGSGWNETQRQFFDVRSNENPSIDGSQLCSDAAAQSGMLTELAGQAGADVEMNYSGDGDGARFMRLQAWSNEDAEEYLDAIAAVVAICDGVTETDDIGVVSSTDSLTGRSIGDDSVSWSTRVVPPPDTQKDKFESVGRTTVARFGEVVMVLQLGDANFAGSAEAMAEDDWWEIVTQAADKLDNLSGS